VTGLLRLPHLNPAHSVATLSQPDLVGAFFTCRNVQDRLQQGASDVLLNQGDVVQSYAQKNLLWVMLVGDLCWRELVRRGLPTPVGRDLMLAKDWDQHPMGDLLACHPDRLQFMPLFKRYGFAPPEWALDERRRDEDLLWLHENGAWGKDWYKLEEWEHPVG
jgi:hypothetical protein